MASPDFADDRLELRHYLAVLRRQRGLIAAVVVGALVLAFAYATLAPKVYEARAEVLVQITNPTALPSSAALPSMDTEREILLSEAVAIRAAEKLNEEGTISDLLEQVDVQIPPETQVLEVSFAAESPEEAVQGAEAFASSYLEFRSEQVQSSTTALEIARRQELESLRERLEVTEEELQQYPKDSAEYLAAKDREQELLAEIASVERQLAALEGASVQAGQIIAHASALPNPVSPNTKLALAIGGFLGVFFGVVLAFVRDSAQGRVGGRADTEEALGAPVLSVVPRRSRWRRGDGTLATIRSARSPVAQAYRILGASLIRGHGRGGRAFLLTGADGSDSAALVAANLAVVLTRAGHRVGVLGAPTASQLDRLFGATPNGSRPGGAQAGLERTRVRGVWIFRPQRDGLGSDLSHPVEVRDVLDRMLDVVDFTVVHSGPLLTSAEAIALAPAVDGVIVVADGRRLSRRDLRRMRTTIERVGGNLLGAVIVGLPMAAAEAYDEQTEGAPAFVTPQTPALPAPRP